MCYENSESMKDEKLEEIYCTEEDVPKTRTRKAFIKNFLLSGARTYYINSDKLQCIMNKKRSITEILAVTKSRFKKTSINDVIRILDELSEDKIAKIVYCTVIKKFVVYINRSERGHPKPEFISNYTAKYFTDVMVVDGLDYTSIMEILEKERKNKEQSS